MRILDLFVGRSPPRSWRRAHEREASMVTVDWRPFGSGVHRVSTTADLSRGGAFLCTASPPPEGSPIVVTIAAPSGPVDVHARVAWRDPRGMGVRFTRPTVRPLTVG